MDILAFLRKRLMHMAPVLFGMVLAVFMMVRLIPGDPVRQILGVHGTPQRMAELQRELGLDQPAPAQFVRFLGQLARGDLGNSLVFHRPVADVISERLPATVFLILYAAILSVIVTIPVALIAALNQDRLVDQVIRGIFTVTLSLPGFWLGLNLLIVFAVWLQLFPVAGYGRDFSARLWHLFLPALTITLSLAPMLIRNLRSAVIDVLKAPYVEFARAKGISEFALLRRHVLRNAMISTVTILALNIGWLMGGSVVIETVFSIPGIGGLIVSSIYARDYPVIQAVALIFGVLVLLINLVTDIIYAVLDPRVSYD